MLRVRLLVGYLLVVDYVNRFRCGIKIDGQNFSIRLRTYDDQSSADYSKAIGQYIVNETDVDILLGGYSSGLTEPLAGVAYEFYCLPEQRLRRCLLGVMVFLGLNHLARSTLFKPLKV